jgi:hypothetical protein
VELGGFRELYALSLQKGAHAVFSIGRVQEIRGISLVFREMWETTAVSPKALRSSNQVYVIQGQ